MLISEKDQNKDHIMEVHWIRVSWQSVEPEWQPRYRKHNKMVLSPASVSRSNHISPRDIPRHHSPIKTCACVFTDVHVLAKLLRHLLLTRWLLNGVAVHVFKCTVVTGNTTFVLEVNYCWETEVIMVCSGKRRSGAGFEAIVCLFWENVVV